MEAVSSNNIMTFTSEFVLAMRIELAFLAFFGSLFLANRFIFPKVKHEKVPPATTSMRAPKKTEPMSFGHRAEARSKDFGRSDFGRSDNNLMSRRRTPLSGADGPSGPMPRSFDESGQEFKHPTMQQLRDEEWFARATLQFKSVQVQRTVELYTNAMKVGLDLSHLPLNKGEEVFVALVTAAIRANQPMEALEMLKVSRSCGFRVRLGLLASATKLCTSKQYYKECLLIYDFVKSDSTLVIDERSVWSCLLFCSVEARAFQRCRHFWEKMQECGTPSNKDYGNMIRYASNQREWHLTLSLIKEMRVKGMEVDNVVYNTALATCVAASQTDEARALLEEMETTEGVVDVITYNTLAKGYARAGRMEQCFELYEHMRERGIAPSQVTYGILLDGCINEKQMDKAVDVFNIMTKEGCVMNTVLYTTLIKGFARACQVEQAMKVYERMLEDGVQGVTPDLITFSILIKANCDAGLIGEAMMLLESMMELRLAPDEVVFNNLLSGCVQQSDDKLGKRLFRNMVEGGLRPSNATFSIMIRLYSTCKRLDEAVELLRSEPQKSGIEPEPRLFVQLSQACLRERQGRASVEVYSMMLQRTSPTPAMTGSILAMCSKLNMLGTGAEILQLAAEAGANVDIRDAQELRQAAVRKKKAQFIDQIDACAEAIRTGSKPPPAAVKREE